MKRILLAGAALAAMTSASFAADYSAPVDVDVDVWSGFFIGIQGGYAFKDLDVSLVGLFDDEVESDDFVIGAYYGRNWQSGNWVFGLDSSISYIGLEEDDTPAVDVNLEANLLGLSRLKIGYAVDNLLFFVAGGVATTYFELEDTFLDEDDDDFAFGWTLGAGVETKFSDNWSARLEYVYFNIESDMTLPTPGDFEVELEGHIVRGGVAYHF